MVTICCMSAWSYELYFVSNHSMNPARWSYYPAGQMEEWGSERLSYLHGSLCQQERKLGFGPRSVCPPRTLHCPESRTAKHGSEQ